MRAQVDKKDGREEKDKVLGISIKKCVGNECAHPDDI